MASTQFRIPLFSALSRALLVLNLILTSNQYDFVRNHINIIPALIKDIFLKVPIKFQIELP